MNEREGCEIWGIVEWWLKDAETDEVLEHGEQRNLIVDQGRGYVQRNMMYDSPVDPGWIIATDTATSPSASEADVPGTNLSAKAATKARPNNTTCRFTCTFGTGDANGTIKRVGLVGYSGGSSEFCSQQLTNAIVKNDTQSLDVQYDLSISWT